MFQAVMNQDGEHYHQQRGLYHLCHEEEQQPKNYRANDGGQNLPRVKQPVNLCCCRGTRSVSLTRKGKRRQKKLPAMRDDVIKAATKFLAVTFLADYTEQET